MKTSWDSTLVMMADEQPRIRNHDAKIEFQLRFKRALARCVGRGFCVEECFGVIWEETLEAIELADDAQAELYPELIAWARHCEA